MCVLLLIAGFAILFVKNIIPAFYAIFLTCLIALRFYGADIYTFIPLFPIAGITVLCLLLRLMIFPLRYKPDAIFFAQLFFSFTLILGGVGFLSAEQYFSLVPLYTAIGLGFMQLFFLVYFGGYMRFADESQLDSFAKMAVYIGMSCVLIYIVEYLMYVPNFVEHGFSIPYFQWKNNVGNYMLLSMPFTFYFIKKNKKPILNSILSVLMVLAMLMSRSRGTLVFGAFVFIVLAIYTFAKSPKAVKIKMASVYGIIFITIFVISISNIERLIMLVKAAIDDGTSGRLGIYNLALELFKENPFTGVGFYYFPEYGFSSLGENMVVLLFHSTFFQMFTSLGILGLMAYSFLAIIKWRQFFYKGTFNFFAFWALMGFSLYSMINTGTVVPFPFVTLTSMLITICAQNHTGKIILSLE